MSLHNETLSHHDRRGEELIFDLPQICDWHNVLVAKVYVTYLHFPASWMTYTKKQKTNRLSITPALDLELHEKIKVQI